MTAREARFARGLRLREAKALGIRIVPAHPGPEFQFRPFACDVAPAFCGGCGMAGSCGRGT